MDKHSCEILTGKYGQSLIILTQKKKKNVQQTGKLLLESLLAILICHIHEQYDLSTYALACQKFSEHTERDNVFYNLEEAHSP